MKYEPEYFTITLPSAVQQSFIADETEFANLADLEIYLEISISSSTDLLIISLYE